MSAFDIGILPAGTVNGICFDGTIHVGFNDSTDLAVPNFPYPMTPVTCTGYSPSISSPGKDVWYKCQVNCELFIRIESVDTVHLSVWVGDSCSNLYPFDCFTIPGGASTHTLMSLGGQTIYLQFSGPNTISDTKFTFCLASSIASCTSTYNFSPTPVICCRYEIFKQDCSTSSSHDGSINISIVDGNGPFTCVWSDSVSGLSRQNLSPGTYDFSITDVNGCVENGSVTIGIMTNIDHVVNNEFFLECNSQHFVIKGVAGNNNEKSIMINDYLGRTHLQKQVYGNSTSVNLSKGIYVISLFDGIKYHRLKIIL